MLDFRILGPLEVLSDDRPLRLGGPKQRAALAILLLNANQVVSAERLADDLYRGAPPATAMTQVQRQVSELRKVLGGEAIETRTPGYVLHVEAGRLDLDRFERWSHDAADARLGGEAQVATDLLHCALELWRGAPLADLTYEPFAQSAIARLDEMRLAALEERFDAELELGRHTQLLGELKALILDHPLRERLRGQLMLALYRAGRQAEALDAYQEIRRALRDELGIEPMPELRLLHTSILRHDSRLDRVGWTSTRLPAQPTTFVGRVQEVAKLVALAKRSDVRVITVSGPGGCGKSRLALQVAADCAHDGEEIVWVPLAPLIDPSLVLPTIAKALGAAGEPAPHIADRKLLLLLDNFEQVIEAAPGLTRLLEACRNLRLLVTSRERLKIAGEHEFSLRPLGRIDAIELFRQRAQALQPEFESDADVGELCERLDDLPLPLELAAARIKVLSTAQLVEQVGRNLDVLRGGRDAAPAQRTLRATIDWSFELLTSSEQALIVRLSAFPGGWTLESAAAVCSADVETLAALVDKSLVQRVHNRYTMLATIRAYMAERLAEDREQLDSTKSALAHYLLTLVQEGAGSLRAAAPQPVLRAKLRPELDNLRSSVTWALEADDVETALLLTIEAPWFGGGIPTEQQQWLEKALAGAPKVAPGLRARALHTAGAVALTLGDPDEADVRLRESLELFRMLADASWCVRASHLIGVTASAKGEHERARSCFEDSLALARKNDDNEGVYQALHDLGELESVLRNYARADDLLAQSFELATQAGDDRVLPPLLHGRGDVAFSQGNVEAAHRYYADALNLELESTWRRRSVRAYCLAGLAAVAATASQPGRAGRLWGAVEALQQHLDGKLAPQSRQMYELHISACRGHFPQEMDIAVSEGRKMSDDEVSALALE